MNGRFFLDTNLRLLIRQDCAGEGSARNGTDSTGGNYAEGNRQLPGGSGVFQRCASALRQTHDPSGSRVSSVYRVSPLAGCSLFAGPIR